MRRRGFVAAFLTALVCAVAATSVLAQGGGGRRPMGMGRGGGLQMLRLEEVQKELKMTPEQVGKIDAKQAEVRQAMQQGGGDFQNMTPEERTAWMAKIQAAQTKAVNEILDPAQQKRFRQLELQQAGMATLTRKDVADELKLTDEQKKKIADVLRQSDDDRRAAMQGIDFQGMSADERAKLTAKMQEIQKTADEKLAAVLTDAQKAQWKEMLGAPFTFPAMPGPGGGGGRRPAAR